MIRSCLQSPPFPAGGPPTLLYGQGPWSGENLCTALEFFFQTNAYHPQASCDKCGHTGCVPLSVKAPPAAIAELPQEVGSRGDREAPESERTPEQRGGSRDTFGAERSDIRRTRATGRGMTDSGDHRGSHPQVSDHHPAHRQIVNFCEVCLQRGSILCEANPRHNRSKIDPMDFLVSEGIFRGRTIPQGATIGHPVLCPEWRRERHAGMTESRRKF